MVINQFDLHFALFLNTRDKQSEACLKKKSVHAKHTRDTRVKLASSENWYFSVFALPLLLFRAKTPESLNFKYEH